MTSNAHTKPSSSSVAPPVSNDCLDSRLTGGMAPRGPGLVPSVPQRVCRAGSTPAQPAGMPAPCSVGPVTQSRVRPLEDPSVFDILNLFRACWFLNREHLLSLVLSAVKGGDNNEVMWIDLLPQAHSHLLHQAKNLAPLSYPSALLKRVMFVFLLEIVNTPQPTTVDKFVKTSAPRWRCVLPLAPPSPPPILNSASVKVGTLAPTRGSEVLPVRTPPGDTDTHNTPMAIDSATDKEFHTLQHVLSHDVLALTEVWDLVKRHGLDTMSGFAVWSAIQAGQSEASVLDSIQSRAPDPTPTPASLSKHPLSSPSPPSPTRPTSPPPRVGSRYGKAPEDWRLWIADCCCMRGGQGLLTKSTLIESADVA